MIFKQYTLNGKRRVSNGKRHVIQRKQTRENVCGLCLNANSCTSEPEKDGKLPFLDVEIFRLSGKFSTSVYRKPTFTGLFTNFHSFIPLAYKRSLVSCLLHRIFNLCSSYENFHAQLEVVRKLFTTVSD